MSSKPPTSAVFPTTAKALQRRLDADLARMARCQQGEHRMQSTQSAGVVICIHCRTLGICPACLPWSAFPDRACQVWCRVHEHTMQPEEGTP